MAAAGSDMEKLQKMLRKRVTLAVDAVCGDWSREQTQTDASLDRSYGSCRKLVAYIAENMATSPGFVEQMDRIILACFSGASRRVLNNVSTQEVWFRSEEAPGRETPRARRPAKADNDDPVIKEERVDGEATTVADGAMGLRTREVAGSLLAKRPRSRTSKKKLSTNKSLLALAVAEPKPKAATGTGTRRDVSSAEESVEAEVEPETDEEQEQEERKRPKKKPTPREKPKALPIEDAHGLLTFKEAIGELCYQERRTPEETEFFKERLRKSIQFVDALLCHPPPGKSCSRPCKKIRASMCKNTSPCDDKMCRIWHDVEAHTDRCKNPKCEFKLRILVRETMHKIHSKQLEVKNLSTRVRRKNAMLDELNATELSEPGTHADSIGALESEIAPMEQSLADEEAEMATVNGTLEKYWATLNEIGIELRDDEIDNFPEFATHYSGKKKRK